MASQQNHSFLSPLRYPGGKGPLANFVKLVVAHNGLSDGDYVEVFAGGASVAWALLFEEYVRHVHLNDLDVSVIAFWRSVLEDTEGLCRLIRDTPVTMEQWHLQRAVQTNPEGHSRLEVGFSTFFLNRTNRSGILKGGVIGGKNQAGPWKMDARYNKVDLIQRIQRIARYAGRIHIYNQDAAHFIKTVLPRLPDATLVYLDPPYFTKGQGLYENHYSARDHRAIADLVLNEVRQPWIVSYDAAAEILSLYEGHPRILYNIVYSAQAPYQGCEVLFCRRDLAVPQVATPLGLKRPAYSRPA
ncbi:MAG: DNA adenine methylase [Sphingomonadaceae bacterium]